MSGSEQPTVSIGLPVYNGENFLAEAIRSLLAQTWRDFELIISDNASSDATPQICRSFVEQDARVRYHRQPRNVGAAANYTTVFKLARGRYFKWAAHDDVCRPEFLARCVEVLDRDPGVVSCHTRVQTIDADGVIRKEWPARTGLSAGTPHARARDVLQHQDTFSIWGVMRADVLRRTPLLGDYPAHDRPLLVELALCGRLHEVPEFLFLEREHANRSVRLYDFTKPHQAVAWYSPDKKGRLIFPAWRLLAEYLRAIRRCRIGPAERVRLWLEILSWVKDHRHALLQDLAVAVGHAPVVGPGLGRLREWRCQRNWLRRVRRMSGEVAAVVPDNAKIMLLDEDTIDRTLLRGWRAMPFPERDGQYLGPPPDDATAINCLECSRRAGLRYLVVGWTAFWWFDYYNKFHHYLLEHYSCVRKSDDVVIFDLDRPSGDEDYRFSRERATLARRRPGADHQPAAQA